MLATLAANPATYMVALIVGASAIASRLGNRALKLGPIAIAGALMYVASTILMAAWRFVDGVEAQTLVWQYGLFVDALIYIFLLIFLFKESMHVFVYFLAAVLLCHIAAVISDDMATKQIAEVLLFCTIAAMAWRCFQRTPNGDFAGLLLWASLMVAEGITAVQNIDCQLLHGMFGVRNEGSACEQVYGVDTPIAILGITSLIWAYLLIRWFVPRR